VAEQPRKQQQPKRRRSKRLNLDKKSQWESIIKSIEKDEVPINLLDSICVNLKDGTSVNIYVKELLDEGNDPDDLEKEIQERLDSLDHIITDVDFYISVPAVSKTVETVTNDILKNL